MTCFNQMWLPISLEEDLSSFERGEAYFLSFYFGSTIFNSFSFAKVGYAICVIDIYMGMFYNTIIGWAVYYFVAR